MAWGRLRKTGLSPKETATERLSETLSRLIPTHVTFQHIKKKHVIANACYLLVTNAYVWFFFVVVAHATRLGNSTIDFFTTYKKMYRKDV